MDRRTFLKTLTHAAAAGAAAGLAPRDRASVPERMTIAAVGDCIPSRRISERRDQPFLAAVELLRSADCTWGNCETVFVDPRDAYPASKELDPNAICESWGADELAWMGIDFVGTANNHTMDWGNEGLFSTLAHLERVGIAHAGAGRDLAAASRPGYCDCPAGRVAQVNCAASFLDYFAAGSAHPHVQGRPGLNPLHVDRIVQVDQELFDLIASVQSKYVEVSGWSDFAEWIEEEVMGKLPEGTALFDQTVVKAGDGYDRLSSAKSEDVERISQAIGVGRNNARVVLATLHAHEGYRELEIPDLFIPPFARATIDAGADMFFAAGPHVLRGIEIYQGKPIFYSLSNFIFHYETPRVIPADAWASFGLPPDSLDPSVYAAKIPYPTQARFWQSVVPLVTVEGGGAEGGEGPRIVAIELHPVTLGFGEPIWSRGTPELARGEQATAILEELARLSKPLGTSIRIRDGVGHVELG
ncbi:MAG: CapA family protein [bacterium]|nr:CapA family protein [bacterium]